MKNGFSVFPLLLLSLLLSGCVRGPKDGKLQVVVSIEPLSYFAERIGGSRTAVSVMVPPGGNPHSYEPTPRQMVRLRNAALFVKAGSGVEFELNWMQRFISLNPRLRICDASRGVRLLPMQHDGEADAHHGRYDPHYWLSPANGIIIARNIASAFAEIDPAHRASYERNAAGLTAELHALDDEIRHDLSGVTNRRFMVFHPAWGYYADRFQLQQIAAEEEGKTLTPRQLQHVIETARKNRISVVFVSPQFSASQAEAIAMEIGGVTRTVDPLSADYQANLRRATRTFNDSMR